MSQPKEEKFQEIAVDVLYGCKPDNEASVSPIFIVVPEGEMEKIKNLQEQGWKFHDFLWTRHDSEPDENGMKFCVPTEEALKYVFLSEEIE